MCAAMRHYFNPSAQPTPQLFTIHYSIFISAASAYNKFTNYAVYFVCTKDTVIFHLYDDRGADLVADKKEKIQHIYHKMNDLILDYDRETIDNVFNTKAE